MIFFLLFLPFVKSSQCFACKGKQFSTIKECSENGYVKQTSDGYFSCDPSDKNSTYITAIELFLVFCSFSAIFILLAQWRRRYLLQGSRFS